MKVIAIVGARPQFIKHAAFEMAAKNKIELITIHTGQHYDDEMSRVFFDELKMERPNYLLSPSSGTHGQQTGKMLIELEPLLVKEDPDYVLVYGDTNSTLAGAIVASKLNIPIIHVESGLRSFNREMPEEINRILTDQISTLLFASSSDAVENLHKEGVIGSIHNVGDIMVDTVKFAESINQKRPSLKENIGHYNYVTIHRPYNTDRRERMLLILENVNKLSNRAVFPIHPRTRSKCREFGISLEEYQNIHFVDPLSYFDSIRYLSNAQHAITDSGGLQKEAYILKVPCVTIRSETEWTDTLKDNWNVLCFSNLEQLEVLVNRIVGEHNPHLYGDGRSAEKMVEIIRS